MSIQKIDPWLRTGMRKRWKRSQGLTVLCDQDRYTQKEGYCLSDWIEVYPIVKTGIKEI